VGVAIILDIAAAHRVYADKHNVTERRLCREQDERHLWADEFERQAHHAAGVYMMLVYDHRAVSRLINVSGGRQVFLP
jgi:hypothetical protein